MPHGRGRGVWTGSESETPTQIRGCFSHEAPRRQVAPPRDHDNDRGARFSFGTLE